MEKSEWKKWYKSKIWQDLRKLQLLENPTCARCVNKVIPATVVNHKIPHKGNWDLFIDPNNLESVCKLCHDSKIQREEFHGYHNEVSNDGWPVDPKHPFNRGIK